MITGSRKAFLPDECRGGILADDMGLGKTLTMLSSIVRSLENADVFAQTLSDQRDPTGHKLISGRIASKTTLVIVPLSRRSQRALQIWPNRALTACHHGTKFR